LTDPALPHCGESVKGRVLMIAEPVGSSSSSAVLLELLHGGNAPVGIVLGREDAIVGLGVLVAREMGWATIPIAVMAPSEQDKIADGQTMKLG
jgi:predicted aconitase with swiveling domain